MNWWGRIFRRRHLYDEVSEEVHQHFEEKTEQLMRLENLSRVEARQAALRAFGNPSVVEQRSREAWQWPLIESLLADAKLSLRRFRNSPGFTMTVILTLAIGIGANTAVFSVVNGVLLKPLPYPQPEQLVALNLSAPGAPWLADFRDGLLLSASMYLTFAAHNRTFESVDRRSVTDGHDHVFLRRKESSRVRCAHGRLSPLAVARYNADSEQSAYWYPKGPNSYALCAPIFHPA